MSMKAIVSEKGQVTIPKAARDQLGLTPGTVLIFYPRDGRLIGEKDPEQLPVGKWKGRGKTLPHGMTPDQYLRRVRDGYGN